MAETIATLRFGGLICSIQDADGGRQTLISATSKGTGADRQHPGAGEAWLDMTIQMLVDPGAGDAILAAR